MKAMLLTIGLLAMLTGCASDGLALKAVQRNEQVWQEDRRADLDAELVKAREAEFKAQKRAFGEK